MTEPLKTLDEAVERAIRDWWNDTARKVWRTMLDNPSERQALLADLRREVVKTTAMIRCMTPNDGRGKDLSDNFAIAGPDVLVLADGYTKPGVPRITAADLRLLIDAYERLDQEPRLGFATTKQLIDELAARADVSATVGESWPSYRTVSES